MKIQAQHVFYLDFQLPIFSGTDAPGVVVQHKDQVVAIEPWNRKNPLFHGELGQTLKTAQFSISAIGVPGGQLVKRTADAVIDRLIVAIEWDYPGDPTEDTSAVQERLEEAVTYANFFIGHLRAITGSAHLKRIEVYWHPDDLTFSVQVPYSITWYDLDATAALPMFQGLNGFNSAGGIRLPFNGTAEWSKVLSSMSTGTLPPFHRSLLVDAREALIIASLREAILCIASACDVRINLYREAQGMISKAKAKQIVNSPGHSFADKYFDLLPKATCGQSLSIFDGQAFSDVENCYQQRNELIHGGDFLEPLKDMSVTERLREVSRWRLSAEKALAWVDSLPTLPK